MDLYPGNKVSQWKTKLSEFVELQDKWEVGLLEVSFPGKVHNIYGNCFYFTVGGLNPVIVGMLAAGTYDSIHSVIGKIQRAYIVAAEASGYPSDAVVLIWYANRYRRVKILFIKYANAGIWLYLSDDLATMLSFEPKQHYWYRSANNYKAIYAKRPVLLTTGTTSVFVYCDLLEHVMIRNVKALLLHTVNRKTAISRVDDKVEHTAFNLAQYVPLQKKSFDTIDILLATDYGEPHYGEPLPFVPGKALVVSSLDERCIHIYYYKRMHTSPPVSYTHLTLPTILRV